LACFASHLPKNWPSQGLTPRTNHLRFVPSWISGAWRFRRVGIAAAAASLQGFSPSAGWGTPSLDFSACGVPGSPGLFPPWGVPFPSLDLTVATTGSRPGFRRDDDAGMTQPHVLSPPCGRVTHARSPLGTSGHTRSGSCSLCFRVSKSSGNWLASSEAAGP